MNRHSPSYWESQTFLATYDVAIVGSGIVGLNAAITLKSRHPKLRIIIIERGVHPIGASTRNAGFACFGSISEVLSDIDTLGYEAALDLFIKRKRGLDKLFEVVDPQDVDYRHYGGSEVFLKGEERVYERCLSIYERLNADVRDDFGGSVFVPDDTLIASNGLHNVRNAIAHPMEGQLHPGKLIIELQRRAAALDILFANGFNVTSLDEDESICRVKSEDHELRARYVLIASNGFAGQLIHDVAVTPARNQVLVTKPISNLKLRGCFHYNQGYVYFRNVDDRVLIGGARHIAPEEESTSKFGLTENITGWLRSFLREHIVTDLPAIEYSWSGIMGVGPEKRPVIRMASARIGVAVRLGGMGVAIGSLVGAQAAELLETSI